MTDIVHSSSDAVGAKCQMPSRRTRGSQSEIRACIYSPSRHQVSKESPTPRPMPSPYSRLRSPTYVSSQQLVARRQHGHATVALSYSATAGLACCLSVMPLRRDDSLVPCQPHTPRLTPRTAEASTPRVVPGPSAAHWVAGRVGRAPPERPPGWTMVSGPCPAT